MRVQNGARILTVGVALYSVCVCVCTRARKRVRANIWQSVTSSPLHFISWQCSETNNSLTRISTFSTVKFTLKYFFQLCTAIRMN